MKEEITWTEDSEQLMRVDLCDLSVTGPQQAVLTVSRPQYRQHTQKLLI